MTGVSAAPLPGRGHGGDGSIAAVGLFVLGPVIIHLLYGARFVSPPAVFASTAISAALVACLGYWLWASAALERRRAVTLAIVVSTAMELLLVLAWHPDAATLGLEPGLGVLTGSGAAALSAAGAAAARRRELVRA